MYIYLFIRMDCAHSYISKYICTHVYTRTAKCGGDIRHRETRNLTRTHHGGARIERYSGPVTSTCVSFYLRVYVPTTLWSTLVLPAGRVMWDSSRHIAGITPRSRDDLEAESWYINATQLLLANHYVRKRDASEFAIPRGPPWRLPSFKVPTSSQRKCWLN